MEASDTIYVKAEAAQRLVEAIMTEAGCSSTEAACVSSRFGRMPICAATIRTE
ncbi:MAG: hypothetical protein ACI8PT_004602 [Gammaproteobacteria bacterium]|jgi:hypothetical protein